ncbi:hypothetical protein SNE40_022039 [Patella caerulea]|uniref:Uncharacterized protein n=1 Tax=Patella caerulea TaxID=87958 RepID=A0AAN8G5C9_PATCE
MRVKEYKVRDYNKTTEYRIRHKPKYHEYSSYYEYNKVRNYHHREYKPTRVGYHGYKAGVTKKVTKPRQNNKRKRLNRPERWPKQIKHCYNKPGGPEYPVREYKQRDYKPKPYNHKYREYNGYRPYNNYPEYKGNVYYELTPQNYYGFRRGNRIYRPATRESLEKIVQRKPKEKVKPKTLPREPKAVPEVNEKPQPLKVTSSEKAKVVVIANDTKVAPKPRRIVGREDNGLYKSHDYTSYHEYDHVHNYSGYREYEAKPYDHRFDYTSKNSADGNPHIVRLNETVESTTTHHPTPKPLVATSRTQNPKPKPKEAPTAAKVASKAKREEKQSEIKEEEPRQQTFEESQEQKTDTQRPDSAWDSPIVETQAPTAIVASAGAKTIESYRKVSTPSKTDDYVQESQRISPTPVVVAAVVGSNVSNGNARQKTATATTKTPTIEESHVQQSQRISPTPVVAAAVIGSNVSNGHEKQKTAITTTKTPTIEESHRVQSPKQNSTTPPVTSTHLPVLAAAAAVTMQPSNKKNESSVAKLPPIAKPRTPSPKQTYPPVSESPKPVPNQRQTIRRSSDIEPDPVVLPLIRVPAPASSRPKPQVSNPTNDVSKGRLPPEVVATMGAYNNVHASLNPMGARGTILRTHAIMT